MFVFADLKFLAIFLSFLFGTVIFNPNFAFSGETIFEGDLPRSALRDFKVKTFDGGSFYDSAFLAVREVNPGSVEEAAGLQAEDILTTLNGKSYPFAIDMFEAYGNLPGGEPASLEVERDGETLSLTFTPPPRPLENISGVDTTYGVLQSKTGLKLRTLLTKPENAEGKLPGIFLSDWTSCNSVEAPVSLQRGFVNLVRGIAQQTGAVFLRIDKPGSGDSIGRCTELDVETTISYQKEGLEILRQHPNVDPTKIFIFGESLGTMIAPLVAEDENILGIFAYGGGAMTWFERQIFFERMQRELAGVSAKEIDEDMKVLTEFYFHYLIEQKMPEEIIAEKPEMARVWAEEISHNSKTKHFGRPIRFHHQMQQKNFAEAWVKSGATALILSGDFDQYESKDASETVINVINEVRPGTAKLVTFPNMNHELQLYPSRKAALRGGGNMLAGGLAVEEVVQWLNEVLNKPLVNQD